MVMEAVVLLLFVGILVGCMAGGIDLIWALLMGLALFLGYGLIKKHSVPALLKMCLNGVKTVRNVVVTLLIVGCLTAAWRASGCIPTIICYAAGLVTPGIFLLMTFLLCSAVSFLLGTAFGTCATMGVILMTMAQAMGMPLAKVGGAMLAGAYFGDRCSPVSTSALLVSSLTKTDIYHNIRGMARNAAVPYALSCAVYLALGSGMASGATAAAGETLRAGFRISPLCLLPAVCILVTAAFRLEVKKAVLISLVSALPIAVFYQGEAPGRLLVSLFSGYHAASPELAQLIDGGGFVSMLRATMIVAVASCYSGIFNGTGMLGFLEKPVMRFAKKCGNFPAMLAVSVVTGMVACNQTLAIILTDGLMQKACPDGDERAMALEDTAVVTSPLIPWSIAGTVSLSAAGAPVASLPFACYLYFLPLWRLTLSAVRRKKDRSAGEAAR